MLADAEQLRKLVDDDKPLPVKTIDQTKQVGHVVEGRPKFEHRLQRLGELSNLGALTATVANKNDRVLSVRKTTEKPTLARTAPAVDDHDRVIVVMHPPLFDRPKLRLSVAELVNVSECIHKLAESILLSRS